jgi:hypothetical protein
MNVQFSCFLTLLIYVVKVTPALLCNGVRFSDRVMPPATLSPQPSQLKNGRDLSIIDPLHVLSERPGLE